MKKEKWAIYEADMEGRKWNDDILAIIEIEYDENDPDLIAEDYRGQPYVSCVKIKRMALEKAAKHFGWKNQYWMSYTADEISDKKMEEYKKHITELYQGLDKLEIK